MPKLNPDVFEPHHFHLFEQVADFLNKSPDTMFKGCNHWHQGKVLFQNEKVTILHMYDYRASIYGNFTISGEGEVREHCYEKMIIVDGRYFQSTGDGWWEIEAIFIETF